MDRYISANLGWTGRGITEASQAPAPIPLGSSFSMLISPAFAQAAEPTTGAGAIFAQMFPLVAIFVIFYFLLIRPQMTARKKHQEMVSNVRRGDVVVTAGGIVGKVTKVLEGEEVMVELADNVTVKVIKATLSDVRTKPQPPAND